MGCCVTPNMGAGERIIRILVGGALVVVAVAGPAEWTYKAWAWVGLVPLLTGALGWCGVYALLGKGSDCCCGSGHCDMGASSAKHHHAQPASAKVAKRAPAKTSAKASARTSAKAKAVVKRRK